MPEFPISDILLARHIAGESSPEEDRKVHAWMAIDPANRLELERLRAAWAARQPLPTVDVDAAWRRVAPRLTAESAIEVTPIQSAKGWRTTLLRLAAAVVLLVGGGALWQQSRTGQDTIHHALEGERLEVTLADGSVALLAPNSQLRVSAGFGTKSRTVHLEGEAWFRAQHEGSTPFTVETPTHVVRDVGTVFTIRTREPGRIEVAVIEGEVAVAPIAAGGATELHLRAGDVGRFAVGSVNIADVESGRSVDSLAGWHRGTLDVESARVQDVLRELSRWYGLPITLADTTLGARTITATLSLVSRDAAMEVLALLLNVSARPVGAGIVLQ